MLPRLLLAFYTVLGSTALSIFNAAGVITTPDDVITNPRKIFHSPSADEYNGVFL
jgi:hypothetical protein